LQQGKFQASQTTYRNRSLGAVITGHADPAPAKPVIRVTERVPTAPVSLRPCITPEAWLHVSGMAASNDSRGNSRMNRRFTAVTLALAFGGIFGCARNAARDVDQPVSARRDTITVRDTTSAAYKAMERSDSATLRRTDSTAVRPDTTGRMVTPAPTTRDTVGTRPATTPPR
jgi:hypothetical protein